MLIPEQTNFGKSKERAGRNNNRHNGKPMPQEKAVPRQVLFPSTSTSMCAHYTKTTENRTVPLDCRLGLSLPHSTTQRLRHPTLVRLSRNKPHSTIYSKQHEPQHLVSFQKVWSYSRRQYFEKLSKLMWMKNDGPNTVRK